MKNVEKTFPGVKALDGAELTLEAGSVHALMGENGAGKSTLMKCLFGVYRMDSGEITLSGESVRFDGPRDALEHGVAMVHQELNQALKLSVSDNMWLGRYPRIAKSLPIVDERRMARETKRILDELGLDVSPSVRMSELSVSDRQMVEIAKAVSYDARVIVFDEPTSSLSEGEVERLFSIIRRLRSEGRGIVYISHKMAEILRICDTVTVMRDGKHISTAPAEELSTDMIIKLMVGRELGERYPARSCKPSGSLLDIRDLRGAGGYPCGVELELRVGEVLGIAGLDGSGRTELLESIFGLRPVSSGQIYLGGKLVSNTSPKRSMANGFALLTEERRKNGIFGILDVRENTTISSLARYGPPFLLSDKKRSAVTRDAIRSMKIKTPSERTRIGALSGGNQQKVILARWLLTEPQVLLLDEPTRGVDVGAKYEIYTLINGLAESGRGIIVASSEMPELLGICDRIAVMSGGRIAGVLSRDEATQEKIMELAGKYI